MRNAQTIKQWLLQSAIKNERQQKYNFTCNKIILNALEDGQV